MIKKSNKQKEQIEKERQEKLNKDYAEYVENIEARIQNGEDKLEVKPYEKWVRKAKKEIDGVETEIEVSGDTGETKNQRFRRLIVPRMETALHALDVIQNLSGVQYESTEKEQEKIVNALKLKVADIEKSFKAESKLATFSLD